MTRCSASRPKFAPSLIRRLDSNSGMADALTFYYANYGDWRKLFTSIDDIDKVTADDVHARGQAVSDAGNAHRGLHGPAACRSREQRKEQAQ